LKARFRDPEGVAEFFFNPGFKARFPSKKKKSGKKTKTRSHPARAPRASCVDFLAGVEAKKNPGSRRRAPTAPDAHARMLICNLWREARFFPHF
jgi:hypothetical protein